MTKKIISGLLFLFCAFVAASSYSFSEDVRVGGFADDDAIVGATQPKPYGETQNMEKMCSPPETANMHEVHVKASRTTVYGAVSAGERGVEVAYATEIVIC